MERDKTPMSLERAERAISQIVDAAVDAMLTTVRREVGPAGGAIVALSHENFVTVHILTDDTVSDEAHEASKACP